MNVFFDAFFCLFAGSKNSKKIKIPAPIEKSIQEQNVRFLHHRNQYTHEYFQFMRKIINANAPYVNSEKVSLLLPTIDGAAVLFTYFDMFSLLICHVERVFSKVVINLMNAYYDLSKKKIANLENRYIFRKNRF